MEGTYPLTQTKILILSLVSLPCVYAQASAAGKLSIVGTTLVSAAQPVPFNALSLATQNSLAPSASLFTGFPSVAGGNPSEGYQGGVYINGMAFFTPWQYHSATPDGTLLAYILHPGRGQSVSSDGEL